MHIDETRITKEIMRIAGGRILVACAAFLGFGVVLGAVFF